MKVALAPSPARVPIALILTAFAALLSGCRHSHVEGTASTEAVIEAFKGAGFDVGGVKKVEPDNWSADYCVSGPVAGLEALVCEYETEQALAEGEKEVRRAWDAVNVETGVVLHHGRTMLSIADRDKKDLGGRAIARLLGAFRAVP